MKSLNPSLSEEQANNHFHPTFKKKHKGKINPKSVIAQKTTSRPSQCKVSQQFRWRTTIDKAIAFLLERDIVICRVTGKSFGELIEHFMIGIDETCLIADYDGYMRIIGEFGKRKHENMSGYCHASAKMCCTGTAGGSNTPTVFLMEGKNRRSDFSDEYLAESGCAVGSTIKMTEKAFMKEEAWLKMTPKLIEGYLSIPYVKDNPQWYVIDIFDGFGAHCMNHAALEMRLEANIISIKEEGGSSSANQAYDKEVENTDKRVQRQILA